MEAHGSKTSYVQYAPNTDPADNIFSASFNVPVFDKNTATNIIVTNNAGHSIITPVSLAKILGDKIDVDEIWHIPIRIIFTEENGSMEAKVTVDLPEWSENEVKPNF